MTKGQGTSTLFPAKDLHPIRPVGTAPKKYLRAIGKPEDRNKKTLGIYESKPKRQVFSPTATDAKFRTALFYDA